MKGRAQIWILSGLLVVILAVGVFGAYKLYKRHQAKALRQWEATHEVPLGRSLEASAMEELLAKENAKLDRYEVLRPVVEQLQLVEFWGVDGPEEALEKLRGATQFRGGGDSAVVFFARDKDQAMAGKLRHEVFRSYQDFMRRESFMPNGAR